MADCTLGPTINLDLIKLVSDQPGKEVSVSPVASTESAEESVVPETFAQVLDQNNSGMQQNTSSQADGLLALVFDAQEAQASDEEVDPEILVGLIEQDQPTAPVLQVLRDKLVPEDLKLYVTQTESEQTLPLQTKQESLWGGAAERVVYKTASQTEVNINAAPKFTEVVQQQSPILEDQLDELPKTGVLDLVHEIDETTESELKPASQSDELLLTDIEQDLADVEEQVEAAQHTALKITPEVQERPSMDAVSRPEVDAITQTQEVSQGAAKSSSETTLMTRAPQIAQDVTVHMKQALDLGEDKVTVHLNPPELGKIEIEMQFSKDGRLHAILIADKPDTYDLLQRNPQMLKEALAGSGLGADMTDLSFNLRQDDQETPAESKRSSGKGNHVGIDTSSEAVIYRQAPSINPMKKVDINA